MSHNKLWNIEPIADNSTFEKLIEHDRSVLEVMFRAYLLKAVQLPRGHSTVAEFTHNAYMLCTAIVHLASQEGIELFEKGTDEANLEGEKLGNMIQTDIIEIFHETKDIVLLRGAVETYNYLESRRNNQEDMGYDFYLGDFSFEELICHFTTTEDYEAAVKFYALNAVHHKHDEKKAEWDMFKMRLMKDFADGVKYTKEGDEKKNIHYWFPL